MRKREGGKVEGWKEERCGGVEKKGRKGGEKGGKVWRKMCRKKESDMVATHTIYASGGAQRTILTRIMVRICKNEKDKETIDTIVMHNIRRDR